MVRVVSETKPFAPICEDDPSETTSDDLVEGGDARVLAAADPDCPGEIRTRPRPDCYLCGTRGNPLYQGLRDRLFGVPGEWSFSICPNPECRLIFLNPVPTEEDLGKAYQVYYTHEEYPQPRGLLRLYQAVKKGYLRRRMGYTQGVGPSWYRWLAPIAWLHPGGSEEIEASVAFLSAPTSGAKLLDVGCGNGALVGRLRDLGWDAEGVDLDTRGVAVAQSKGLPVRLGEVDEQGFPGEHFDVVHLGDVIEHVHDPIALLRKCHRVLKPGGTLVLLTPNMDGWGHRHFGQDYFQLDPPRHLILFGRTNLEECVSRAGFKKVQYRSLYFGARGILAFSHMFRSGRRTGRKWQSYSRLERRLRGICYQIWARSLLSVRRQAGEEILCIAHKN